MAIDVSRHISDRNPVYGEFWPVIRSLGHCRWSKELWHYSNGEWNLVITADRKITELGKSLPFVHAELGDSGKIFRVVHRDQLAQIGKYIVHLPPVPCNKLRMKRNFYDGVNAFAINSSKGVNLLSPNGPVNLIERVDAIFTEDNPKIVEFDGHKFTAYEVALSRLLFENFDSLCEGLQSNIPTLQESYLGLIYVYNAYLGSTKKHFINFKNASGIALPPEVYNFGCRVRFFSPKSHLSNCINYVVCPSVFRGYDMYRRGVDGATARERLSKYVVIEYKYNVDDIKCGRVWSADFEHYAEVLTEVLRVAASGSPQPGIEFPHGLKQDNYHDFLISALRPWSNIFAEVRVEADGLLPSAIWSIEANWCEGCSCFAEDTPCPVCTTFKIGERFDCSDPGILGTLLAYGLGPMAEVDESDVQRWINLNSTDL